MVALWLCPQIRQALELRLGQPLQQYRDFIDNQMLLLMAQQDRASRIFPHLYLVSSSGRGAGARVLQAGGRRTTLPSHLPPQGSEWNAANLEELQRNRYRALSPSDGPPPSGGWLLPQGL